MTDRQCPSCGGFCKKECERADVMATDEVLRLELMQEEIDDLKNQLELLAKETVYRGNSVAYIYTKMVSYKKAIGDIWKILNENGIHENGKTPITEALRQALAHSEQEPVVEFMGRRLTPEKTRECWGILLCDSMLDPPKHTKLYTAPLKREWVGLTDEEIGWIRHNSPSNSHEYARAIEAKLKEKNTF